MNVCDTSPHSELLICQMWFDYVKEQKSCGLNTKPCKQNLLIWSWGQKSTPYWDHECRQHILQWWYTYMLHIVSQCKSKKMLRAWKTCIGRRIDKPTDRRTEWFLYIPHPFTSFTGCIKMYTPVPPLAMFCIREAVDAAGEWGYILTNCSTLCLFCWLPRVTSKMLKDDCVDEEEDRKNNLLPSLRRKQVDVTGFEE